MHATLQAAERGSHILAVYPSKEKKLEEAFQFLKAGFDANEVAVLITDDLTKDEARRMISKEWKVDNVEMLEARGDVLIMTTEEGYFPKGKVENDNIIAQWKSISESAVSRGRNGLRVFGDMTGFFKNGFASELVDYESALPVKYDMPVIGLCAYEAENISGLTPDQLATLHRHHGLYHLDGHNVLVHPQDNNHLLMIYDDDSDAHLAIADYINEGLEKGELCVYASVHMKDEDQMKGIASKITDYEKNITDGNLIVYDFAPFYIAAMSNDLTPFEDLKQTLSEKARERKDKHIRLVGDCVTFLFENKHFDECMALEDWWDRKPFVGSYMCPFPKSVFEKYPFNHQKLRLLTNHDLVIDSRGRIIAAYLSNDSAARKRAENQ